jgi:hypothetical protein
MVKLTQRDLAIIAGTAGVADFLMEGRFSAPVARALKKVFRKGAPVVARGFGSTAARLGGTAVRVGKTVALRHPVLTAGAVVYYTYKNKDEIIDLLEQGYEITESVRERARPILDQAAQIVEPLGMPAIAPPRFLDPLRERFTGVARKKSSFNKAVGAGMKAVKSSTSYGKKGTINAPKKAFSMVTKVASSVKKKLKAPKKGIRKKVYSVVKRLL